MMAVAGWRRRAEPRDWGYFVTWLAEDEAMAGEFQSGAAVLAGPGLAEGVGRFRGGAGRGGTPA